MDFFQQQDQAKANTTKLYVLLGLAVLAITALVSVVVVFAVGTATNPDNPLEALFYSVPLSILGIGGASALKTSQIRNGGGSYVALSLGGRQLDFTTQDGHEKQLANIVEEVAIAAGMPVPNVYVLDNEPGINAFAAGWTPENSVIGVTRGAMKHLSRNELQGVIAHEFAHIYNGDTKVKTKIIGLVFGILVLAFLGRLFLNQARFGRLRSRSRNDGVIIFVILGVALLVIGYVGSWFARRIQAAVSRQREYLADASGVQFTRDPDSLGRALAKIGGLGEYNNMMAAHSIETNHLFFSPSDLRSTSSHPPLQDRIKRLMPAWNGEFIVPETVKAQARPDQTDPQTQQGPLGGFGDILGGAGTLPGGLPSEVLILGGAAAAGQTMPAPTKYAAPTLEGPTEAHMAQAQRLIAEIPAQTANMLRTGYGAAAAVIGLLLSSNSTTQEQQLTEVSRISGLDTDYLLGARALVKDLADYLHLPAIDIALHGIHQLPRENKEALIASVEAIEAHNEGLDLFRWVLRRVLIRHLNSDLDDGYRSARATPLSRVSADAELVLAVIAGFSATSQQDQQAVYETALQACGLARKDLPTLSDISFNEIDHALTALSQLGMADKRTIINAAANAVLKDGVVQASEAQLLRVVADAVGLPIPPLLPQE